MKRIISIIFCLSLMGCAPLFLDTTAGLTNFKQVALGMTKQEVASVMGNSVIVGYDIDPKSNSFKPITIPNPHRRDVLKSQDKKYELEFFITHIRQPDGKITDDELTPFIYHNNKLVGTGWPYLNYLLKNR